MMPQADPGFEVADAQLDRGVAAVILVQPHTAVPGQSVTNAW
jgi:hypothetical protein